MGFRFRRRIKLVPGVTLNVSKSGITTTVGRRGASVTLGNGKRRYNVGIPGTGISYSAVEKAPAPPENLIEATLVRLLIMGLAIILFLVLVAR